MRRALLLLSTVVLVALTCAPAGSTPQRHLTVVSLTFDGTDRSQDGFADLLAARGLAGTFYINSGLVGYPGHLSIAQLRTIARDRSEIGGASLEGNDLTTMTGPQIQSVVCDDRTTLAQLGFELTSFAYPHGASNPTVQAAAKSCGYNSGRDLGGLYQSALACSSCPAAETLPPTNPFAIPTGPPPVSLSALKAQVLRAELTGGWLPLVFTKLCLCPVDQGGSITRNDFTAFVAWLAQRPDPVEVRTVDQVIGGAYQPVHGVPLQRLVPDPSAAISPPTALSKVPAWTVLGIGVGQQQILLTGVVLSTTMVITYRLASRGNRHAH